MQESAVEEVIRQESVAQPVNLPAGMPKEAAELYNELEKWTFTSLKAKFVERIQTHLRANPVSRDQVLAELDKFDLIFKA